jgi:anti-sigma B factor antagonist
MGARRNWHEGVRLDVRAGDRAVTIAVSGDLDLHEAGRVERAWKPLSHRADVDRIVLDLRGLRLIDSSGIALVLSIHADCRSAGRELAVVRPPDSVMHRFEATGVTEHLPLVDDLECRAPDWTNG